MSIKLSIHISFLFSVYLGYKVDFLMKIRMKNAVLEIRIVFSKVKITSCSLEGNGGLSDPSLTDLSFRLF